MPRPNLRGSQPVVEEFCRQRGILYCQTSLISSYSQALQHLNVVGKTATRRPLARQEPVAEQDSVAGGDAAAGQDR
jgi:hypothetical protein